MLTVVYYVGPQSAAEKEYWEWAFGLWFSLVQQIPNTVSDRGKRPMGVHNILPSTHKKT